MQKKLKFINSRKIVRLIGGLDHMDTQIGRMIDLLEKNGKLENTLILFISDNGGVYRFTKNWPLRAGKGAYYEGRYQRTYVRILEG